MTLESGAEFAGYRIERKLGAGGMGEVYLARHPRLPRNEALKVLAPQFTSEPHYRARFEREAELAAGLTHPAIVAVHDRGETDGRLWIAMAYVDGEDLAQRVRSRGPLDREQTAHTVAVIADALTRAHARGLVHRDVKPANILLSTDGDVMLTDFGIARSNTGGAELTSTGMTVGTVDFASPEQLQGMEVDGRSDQYSLACTAFALLTGTAPFAASSAARVISSQLNDPMPSVRQRRPDVSPAVDAVLARATSKNPAGRFASCSEFATALRSALAHDAAPPTLTPPQPQPPGGPAFAPTQAAPAVPRRRRRTGVIVAAVLGVLVLIGGAVWFMLPDRLTAEDGDYVQEPTDTARSLRLPDVTPPLASLEHKPTAAGWTYMPPKGVDFGYSVVGAVGDTVLVGRSGALDIVDAATAKTIRTARISGDDAPNACGANARGTWVACEVGMSGTMVIVDLASARVTGATYWSGEAFAVVGDTVILESGSGENFTVEAIDRRARTVWERKSTTRVSIGGPVVGVTPPPDGDAFASTAVLAIRVSDGKEIARVPTDEGEHTFALALTSYASGFVLGDHFYDNDGRRLAAVPDRWAPVTVAQGYPLQTPTPALPLLASPDHEVGVADPTSGDLLWSRLLDGAYSAHATASGASVMIDSMGGSDDSARRFAWYDLATGEGSASAIAELYDVLGSDGTRVAVASPKGLTAFGPDGELWTLPLDDGDATQVVAAGGHLYLRGQRLL